MVSPRPQFNSGAINRQDSGAPKKLLQKLDDAQSSADVKRSLAECPSPTAASYRFYWNLAFFVEHLAKGENIALHPVAFAGWVGIFITALNLIPIGQLDGGHILYALLLRRAGRVAQALLVAAMLAVVVWGYWGWTLMIVLLMMMGPVHPPTANDDLPLGTGRTLLGWASLLFVLVGFTPMPFGP